MFSEKFVYWACFKSKISFKSFWFFSLDLGLTWSFHWYKTSCFASKTTYRLDLDFVSIEGHMHCTANNKFYTFPISRIKQGSSTQLEGDSFLNFFLKRNIYFLRILWPETMAGDQKICSIQSCHWISLKPQKKKNICMQLLFFEYFPDCW